MAWTKVGSDNSATRTAILDAAQAIMTESGYSAVTSRAVAERAGLKSQLVHYYFRTMDDLYVAIYRRAVDEMVERQKTILGAERPLRALWELSGDPKSVALTYELVALANHRKALRAEIAVIGDRLREGAIAIVSQALEKKGLSKITWLPVLSALLLESLARSLSLQSAMGQTVGHAQALAAIEGLIDFVDG
jgi:AcrR family transcriptional regulator